MYGNGETRVFSRPAEPDVSFFDTDFGVRIGLLVCFDLNHEIPAKDLIENGVQVIAFPTDWVDGMPFLAGLCFKMFS